MKKTLTIATTILISFSLPANAERVNAKVKDQYVTEYVTKEVVDLYCEVIEVPVYETRSRAGNAAGGALLGMIIGGVAGKAITDKDNGAAAGAIVGGIIGADQGSKPKTEQVIVGYREEKSCYDKVTYIDEPRKIYSHSTLMFTIDGKEYKVDFVK